MMLANYIAIFKKINLDFTMCLIQKFLMDQKPNVKNEMIQILEEKNSEFIYNLWAWKEFLTITQNSDAEGKVDIFGIEIAIIIIHGKNTNRKIQNE